MMALTVAREDPKKKELEGEGRAGLELMRARKEVGRREQVGACE